MKVETKLARNASFEPDLDWLGRSGVELAKWVISSETGGPFGQVDSLKKYWAGGPGETNDYVTTVPLKNHRVGETGGFVDVSIVDLDRKININTADKIMLQEALTYIGIEDGALISTIIDSILDWRDRDNATQMSGAESDDYTANPNPGYPPYVAKNGPIDDISELLMIRGVTPAMYWGPKAGTYSTLLKKRSGFEEPIYHMGLVDIFTAVSSGRVNVNTVDERVLQALPGVDAMVAEQILRARKGLDGQDATPDDTPIPNVGAIGMGFPGMPGGAGGGAPMPVPQPGGAAGAGGMPPGMNPLQALSQFLTVRSLVFEVTVDARFGNFRKRYVALLRRNGPKDIQTLNMYSK
jgi:general secretion pathway protein K